MMNKWTLLWGCTPWSGAANLIQGKCWDEAYSFFQRKTTALIPDFTPGLPSNEDSCIAFSDIDKKMMALLMADCHLASRTLEQSLSTTCSFPILKNIDWHVPTALEDFEYTVIECLKGLTDMNFGVYISFLNHIGTKIVAVGI
eukprot:Protomagalhaensia_sp_Gyna_25__3962@NODE_356_length_3753_cov_20_164243_g275_i0_p3_GENE_NODE_356_length_3753_cov_20_164243_g275_i0NODE_356_length_3753_cov_20_164243_g275_i0_p3_ORF_typecomplete_len143_score18_40DUF4701/PF15773_5/0_23_NODE_356_length_3753_cov_20_164243_g275_i032753703